MDQLYGILGPFYEGGHAGPFLLIIFFVTFVGILIYVLGGRKRSQRIENEKYSIFDEEGGPEQRKSHKEDAKDGKES